MDDHSSKPARTLTPRVYAPFAVNVSLGLLLVALGEKELGVGAILAALTAFGVGYGTRPTYPTEDGS